MKTTRGFAWLPVLILAGLVILGGGTYIILQNNRQTVANPPVEYGNQGTTSDGSNTTVTDAADVSLDIFNTAAYTVPMPTKSDASARRTFTMSGGVSRIGVTTACNVSDATKVVLAATTDKASSRGVVTMYCNYGASATDVYLVAFKNLQGTPVQTDIVDLRKHPDMASRNLFRVGVKNMSLAVKGQLSVTALVVPDALRNAAGADQAATEPVSIRYQLESDGKLLPVASDR